MIRLFIATALLISPSLSQAVWAQEAATNDPRLTNNDSRFTPAEYDDEARQIIDAALQNERAFDRLAYMVDTFGPRFSGTPALENAIDWVLGQMRQDGLENVRGEEVVVPRWVRGEESLRMLEPRTEKLALLGLGGSVGTPVEGITADVLVVRSFEELEKRGADAAGRIVLFNAPFTSYGETVAYRTDGASRAARHGAVASLIRSVGPASMYTPHTGMMRYEDGVQEIPHAAITLEDAEMLQRMFDRGQRIRLTLKMEARTLPDVPSRNIIAEIRGTTNPEEVIVLGGHIDSWDVGQGAMDDGGGCVAAWEAVRLLKELNLRPRRTVRVVLW
ncbi:MAG: M28 family peptidase, partial [Rhodothermales bacterium]